MLQRSIFGFELLGPLTSLGLLTLSRVRYPWHLPPVIGPERAAKLLANLEATTIHRELAASNNTTISPPHHTPNPSPKMPPTLSEYVASRYLTADPKPSTKKRKRKHDKSASGLIIQDDDDWAASSSSTRKSKHHRDGDAEADDNTPITVGTVKDLRKTTKANWKPLDGGPPAPTPTNDESAAADAILAQASAENEAARQNEDDDNPTVVVASTPAARMTDGSYAGLQSAAAVTAQLARRAADERAQFEAEKRAGLVKSGDAQETFYRDATGRRIDVSEKRAEARRAARAAEEAEIARKEGLKGEVQVEEARARRERLADAKGMALARGADDEEMNDELRGQMRWNDPMAKFLEAGETSGGGGAGGAKGKGASTLSSSVSRRPVYKGACPPNRYGIKPGYRWDGVDRGNGFESERFKALNRRERNKDLNYQWQMDE